jgi:hypothetical protein
MSIEDRDIVDSALVGAGEGWVLEQYAPDGRVVLERGAEHRGGHAEELAHG